MFPVVGVGGSRPGRTRTGLTAGRDTRPRCNAVYELSRPPADEVEWERAARGADGRVIRGREHSTDRATHGNTGRGRGTDCRLHLFAGSQSGGRGT